MLIVGDGPAAAALRARADGVNDRLGREVVKFTGSLADPREAYAAADLVVGMGSSSLRAMAMGKPVIAQGERGFSKVFEEPARDYFLHHGFWGVGDGQPNAGRLAAQARPLLGDESRLRELAAYGQATVRERFSLERGTRVQLEVYEAVAAAGVTRRWGEAAGAAGRAVKLELDNHDPRRKRARAGAEAALLAAAGAGTGAARPELAPIA